MKKPFLVITLLTTFILFCGCGAESEISKSSATEIAESTDTLPLETEKFDTAVSETSAVTEEITRVTTELPEELKNTEYNLTDTLNEPPLKDEFSDYFFIGAAINGNSPSNAMINSPEMAAVAKYHFNATVYSNLMKPAYLLDKNNCVKNAEAGNETEVAVDFSACIPGLEFAKENNMVMRGHVLVWHTQTPDWFFKTGFSEDGEFVDKETMLARMESYIKQVLEFTQENYPGIIIAWDVVNEAVETSAGDYDNSTGWYTRTKVGGKDNLWYITVGPDYVEKGFEYARKYATEDVKLFYNDYNTFQPLKNTAICKLVTMLKEKDLIDGIGMQSHYGIGYPNSLLIGTDSLRTALLCFAALDLEIHMTELSISVDDESEFEKQAKRFKDFFDVVLEMHQANGGPANITCVMFFGLMDEYLFYNNNTDREWLFDKNLGPKPSFYSVLEAVKKYKST